MTDIQSNISNSVLCNIDPKIIPNGQINISNDFQEPDALDLWQPDSVEPIKYIVRTTPHTMTYSGYTPLVNRGIVDSIMGGIATVIAFVIKNIFNTVLDLLRELFPGLNDIFTFVTTFIKRLAIRFLSAITNVFGMALNGIKKGIKRIIKGVNVIAKALGSLLMSIARTFGEVISTIARIGIKGVDTLAKFFTTIFSGIVSSINTFGLTLSTNIPKVTGAIISGADFIISRAFSVVNSGLELFDTIVVRSTSLSSGVIRRMFVIADQMVSTIARAAKVVIGNVSDILRSFLNALKSAIASVMRIMVVTATSVIEALVDLTDTLVDGVVIGISKLMDMIGDMSLPSRGVVYTTVGGGAIAGGMILGVIAIV